jgi:hypothetical protein
MKGEVIMSRLEMKLRSRCKRLLFLPFVLAVAALFWGGINVTCAGADQGADQKDKHHAKNSHEYHAIRDPRVDSNLTPKQRARVQRETAIKNRADARMFIQNVMEGKQPAAASEGGAK